jgi:hypothetical protein
VLIIVANTAMPQNWFLTSLLRLNISPLSQQGTNDESNLALACRSCNLRKGTRISDIDNDSNSEVQFFHPRQNLWGEHFQIDTEAGMVMEITAVGKVTVENLKMNSAAQVAA